MTNELSSARRGAMVKIAAAVAASAVLASDQARAAPAPTWGSFADGVGRWDANEVDAGKAVIVRGEWDLITPQSCRWRQAVSHDDGKTWHENWRMHWQRA